MLLLYLMTMLNGTFSARRNAAQKRSQNIIEAVDQRDNWRDTGKAEDKQRIDGL